MAHDLAPGAVYKNHRQLPSVIPTHTLPDIREDSIIIGVCGVPATEDALLREKDGWFMSDFCAFNFLLKGLGSKQTWMTASSEASFLEFISAHPEHEPGLLHGNPYNDRKVVFSESLLEKKELTAFTAHSPSDLVQKFLKELKDATSLAKTSMPPRPIVLLIFGHGTESLGVRVDYSKSFLSDAPNELLMFRDINSAIASDIPTTIITTACYSGGWAIKPDVNMTILTAADACDPDASESSIEPETSKSWNLSKSIGRACGSIFASTIIESLSASTSPLLEAGSHLVEGVSQSLQPQAASSTQTETYNAFCHTILETLKERITRMPEQHVFCFSAQDDEWAQCWMARVGIPLEYFKARWDQLPVYVATMPNNYTNWNPTKIYDPTNSSDPGSELLRGGISTKSMALPLGLRGVGVGRNALDHIRQSMRMVAWKLANSCPGDLQIGPNLRNRGVFLAYAGGENFSPEHEEALLDIIIYRDQVSTYVDYLVRLHGLPKAQGKTTLEWDRDWWGYRGNFRTQRWKDIAQEMHRHGPWWKRKGRAGEGFGRAQHYLMDCIYQSEFSISAARALIQEMAQNFQKSGMEVRKDVLKNRSVRHQAGTWLRTIGKTMRSLSPVKKGPQRASVGGTFNKGN
ncbi:hypothetical protein AK830_g7384 [Neonectria ditissima]|uniref:Uncharacterized protein n=1 Tax=Neonectria ditissima TaxID=78410 RepID=A0A0P7BGB4_9HYPO|nr:hypothetical protein AK830_g7384 [Neonectria ditissima]